MKVVSKSSRVVVIDDFLTSSAFQRVADAARTERYQFINGVTWDQVYEISDGRPLESAAYVYGQKATISNRDARPPEGYGGALKAVRRHAPVLAPWLANAPVIVFRASIFPPQSALTWHDDGRNRAGTFALYLHEEWGERWGGELLVRDVEHSSKAARANDLALGLYIPPRRNRCVLIRAGTPHMIKRVEPAAGDAMRMALAGSFVASPEELRSYRRDSS